jgi:hypothetical protein
MIAIFFVGIWGLLMGLLIRESSGICQAGTRARLLTASPALRLLQDSLVVTPRLCRRSRMPQVVSDVVGSFWCRSLRTLGRSRRTLLVSDLSNCCRWSQPRDAKPLWRYRGTCLWLWLGVLDAIQGVGLGMILLQTLSRLHVCATLALAQMVGSIVAIIARATAPDKNGPGGVFPNPSLWDINGTGDNNPLAEWAFWVALICQIIIVIGYFVFFRKEQLVRRLCLTDFVHQGLFTNAEHLSLRLHRASHSRTWTLPIPLYSHDNRKRHHDTSCMTTSQSPLRPPTRQKTNPHTSPPLFTRLTPRTSSSIPARSFSLRLLLLRSALYDHKPAIDRDGDGAKAGRILLDGILYSSTHVSILNGHYSYQTSHDRHWWLELQRHSLMTDRRPCVCVCVCCCGFRVAACRLRHEELELSGQPRQAGGSGCGVASD